MKTKEIINQCLKLYMRANKLENLKYYNQNQSYATHIYGSMILAVAINSEFNITTDIAKVLRILILSNIKQYDHELYLEEYLGTIPKGKQYLTELSAPNTPEFALAKQCEELDEQLYDIINIPGNEKIAGGTLYELAVKQNIFNPQNENEDRKCQEIFRFYYLNDKLKNKDRSGWDEYHWRLKSNRIEKVSEHIFATLVLALVISLELEPNINIDKVLKTLTIHEIGEILIGDLTPFDNVAPEEKKKIEHQAIIKVIGDLTEREELINLIFEFDEIETPEAKFEFYCDKIQADIKSKIYEELGLNFSLAEQENNIVLKSNTIKKIIADGARTVYDVWHEYDKPRYNESNTFSSLLEKIKETPLTELCSKTENKKSKIYSPKN